MVQISIIMPCRNASATVDAAVGSLVGQTAEDWELIAVDDGSTDATPKILDHCAGKDPRIRLLRQSHGGIVRALNAGLEMAEGRFIARMDADDVAAAQRLERQREFLEERPEVGVVSCRVSFGGDRLANAGYAAHVDWINQLIEPEEISIQRFVEAPVAHPSVLFRAQLVKEFGGYCEGGFPEDYELWLRWMDAGVRFGKVPDDLLIWNDPPERLSRQHERYSAEAFFRVKARYLARWLARKNPRHPRVFIVGSGRVTRRRVEWLLAEGVEVEAYIDIDPRKIGRWHHGVPVIAQSDLPAPGKAFVVSYIGKRETRGRVAEWMDARGYRIGRDWIPAA